MALFVLLAGAGLAWYVFISEVALEATLFVGYAILIPAAVVAIVLSVVALARIAQQKEGGRGFAIAVIVLAVVNVLAPAVYFAVMTNQFAFGLNPSNPELQDARKVTERILTDFASGNTSDIDQMASPVTFSSVGHASDLLASHPGLVALPGKQPSLQSVDGNIARFEYCFDDASTRASLSIDLVKADSSWSIFSMGVMDSCFAEFFQGSLLK